MKRVNKVLKFLLVSAMTLSTIQLSVVPTFAEEKSLVEYVDTLFGTDVDEGSTSAGPSLPNGSIHPSPETSPCDNGGYKQGNPVVGFAQIYAQGTGGVKSYGNFLLSPQTGAIKTSEGDHKSSISNELGQANYYTATLDKYGIKAEITPNKHAASYRFTYPGEDSSLVFDVGRGIGNKTSLKNGSITIDKENHRITGGGLFGGDWNPKDWNMYFAMEFDNDFTEIGTWDNGGLHKDTLTLNKSSKEHYGAYVKFDTKTDKEVNVKIAISFVSVEKAKEFLDKEIPNFDFEGQKANAEKEWNEVLGKVELGDNVDEASKRMFYTALYGVNIQPRDRTEDHGTWDDYYTVWDSWRTVFPFLQLTRPELVASNINSFIKRWDENGILSDAYIHGKDYLVGQGGNDLENIIADAYLKKIPGVDWKEAYRVLKEDAEHYRSSQYADEGYHYSGSKPINGVEGYSWRVKPASATIGFAYNDYSVATMAKDFDTKEVYEKYLNRSKNWLNNWDENLTSSDGYKGFIHKRNGDGSYPKVDPSQSKGMDGTEYLWQGYNDDFYEAGIWEGSYSPTFDLATLVEKMGGKYEYADRLDYALGKHYMNFANEPSFQTIWTLASDEVQRPDLASKWVDVYLNKYSDSAYPGDEDNGAMSSMYLFMMSGFFPMSGTNNYYLHGTRLPEMTYHLGTGKDFKIIGKNAGGENIYVQSATWNGKPLNVSKLTYEQISAGGTLEYVMGSEPSDWGREVDEENPSDVRNLKLDDSKLNEGILSLTWDAATDDTKIKEYNVYCSTNENVELSEENKVATTKETTYSFEASNGVKYYRVEAVDNYGKKSVNPPVIKVESVDSENPVLSGTLSIDERYLGIGQVKLSWNEATDNTKVKEYRVYRSTKDKFDLTEDTLIGITKDLTFVDTKAKGTWVYKVVAVDIFGNVSNAISLKVENANGFVGKELNSDINIALNKTATASGQHGQNEAPKFAVDGNIKTKWCVQEAESSAQPHFWMELDLGDVYQLDKYVLKNAELGGEQAKYNTRDFKLQVKSPAGEWLDVDSVVGNKADTITREIAKFETQYIRLYITEPVQPEEGRRIVRLPEFELYGDMNAHDYAGSIMGDEGVVGKVNGQANDREGAEKAFDFNPETKWSCRTTAADNGKFWLEVKLPQLYTVRGLEMLSSASENPEYITENFNLQVKENGEWKDILTVTGNADNFYHGDFDKEVVGDEFRLVVIPRDINSQVYNVRLREFHLLGEKVVIKDELQKAYDEYSKLEQGNFTDESWNDFQDALTDAKEVLEDASATQGEVDAVKDNLKDAYDNLTLKAADYSKVDEAIAKAEVIDRTKYTEESLAKLDAAIEAVVRDLDITKQEEVEAMAKAIEDAIAGLVEWIEWTPIEPSEPVIPWTPLEPSKPIVPTTPIEPSTPVDKEDKEEGTDTGDTSNAAGMAGLMLLAGAVIVSKKRKATK